MTKDTVTKISQYEVSLIILQIISILCAAVKNEHITFMLNKTICDTKKNISIQHFSWNTQGEETIPRTNMQMGI